MAATLAATLPTAPASAALPSTSTPVLSLARLIRTHPFVGSSVSMQDNEGSAYVARDHSLWLCDDIGRRLYEVDPTTGALKRTIGQAALSQVPQLGDGPLAGKTHDQDLESLAYDSATDTLYAFSGVDTTTTPAPAVFRLKRVDGQLQPVDYQPLAAGSDFTASAWNPGDGKLYVGYGRFLQRYDYATNKTQPPFSVPDLTHILGLEFSADGRDLFVARAGKRLSRVDWARRTLVPGWTFDLSPFGVLDPRDVELIGDQFYVGDGEEGRADDDPMNHAVFVFDVSSQQAGSPVVAPTASFATSASSGAAPLSVSFTDQSAGSPTGWVWSFGDGQSATVRAPSHVYTRPGTYTVRLTVSNSAGSSSATRSITVADLTAPTVSLTRPTVKPRSVTSWARLRGRAHDSGSGVRAVLLRVTERRGSVWYAYRGPAKGWVPASGSGTALEQARLLRVAPASTRRWTLTLKGLRPGTLVVRVAAGDNAGNVSAYHLYRQRLTRI